MEKVKVWDEIKSALSNSNCDNNRHESSCFLERHCKALLLVLSQCKGRDLDHLVKAMQMAARDFQVEWKV
ncbi:hypothetical protein Cni_G22335 [Canna indica]|uniref:Uncharacterized protein n=1 Tax=Canna indica TaxID=4628 RepID=A0AAQ3KSI0_9LILI|nr:hypothetical protein Cni_G22335 [Canna indica]